MNARSSAGSPSVTVHAIADGDVPRAADFLHEHLNRRLPPAAWTQGIFTDTGVACPNHGYLLAEGDRVVGCYLAYYSERTIDGVTYPICNLGAWCVLEGHRFHSVRLLKALLAQEGYHFVDLSPSGNVVALNKRMGFESLDTTTAVVPNLPWPRWFGRKGLTISSDPATIRATLGEDDLAVYDGHERAAAARHLVVRRGHEYCYVIFRKDRRKDLPVFASILYVSNVGLFRTSLRLITRTLLLRHRALATLAELRIAGPPPPRASMMLPTPRPKMFKSDSLAADQIDYLYSELTALPW